MTAAVALLVAAELGRRLGPARLALAVAVVCALGLRSLTVPSAAFALLLGAAAGLALWVAIGVLPARPAEDLVRAVLARAGWPVATLRPLEQTAGQVRHAGVGAGGAELRVTVVDPNRRRI